MFNHQQRYLQVSVSSFRKIKKITNLEIVFQPAATIPHSGQFSTGTKAYLLFHIAI
jgi:hypothetical protein